MPSRATPRSPIRSWARGRSTSSSSSGSLPTSSQWDSPPFARFFERISAFSRLILFDKRGTGLSDPVPEAPTLEQRVDDVRAVMDAAGSERAALFGISESGPMSVLFAATHPERATALILHGAMGRTTEAPDYPWATPEEALREALLEGCRSLTATRLG